MFNGIGAGTDRPFHSFRTMGVNVVAGRGITDDDGWDAPRVAIVSRSLAHDHFERQGAVGRNIQIGEGLSNWYRVVGVVDDLEPTAFGGALGPRYAVYLSALQHPPVAAQLLVRPRENAPRPDVSATLGDFPGVTSGGASIEEAALVRAETAPIRWFGRVIGLEGWIVLLLAIAGAFALMHLWVLSVRQEIGVRRAVGASRARILIFIVSRSLAVVAGGVLFACWLGIMVWGSLSATITGLAPFQTSVARASPNTASASPSQRRGCVASFCTSRAQSATSTGAWYSSSSAMLTGSRSIATKYVHCSAATPTAPCSTISSRSRPCGGTSAVRRNKTASPSSTRNVKVTRVVVRSAGDSPARRTTRDTPAFWIRQSALSTTRAIPRGWFR